ncbi:asparagine synthase-related protein [Thiocapsa imhoffii]|nr:asparagine synthase-related protein [Thiocapsa imhoffii]
MGRDNVSSAGMERDLVILGERLRERMLPFGWFERLSSDSVRFVTDHAGSVPLYYAQEHNQVLAGKTPLEVFQQMPQGTLDTVSVADFLLNGTVCYPYTLFKGIYVAPPGAVTDVTPLEVKSTTYYRPKEQESNEPLAYWGAQLRARVQQALLAGLEGKTNIKVLFSGGEDSRAIVSLLPKGLECELVTFADSYNREVRLASHAARALDRHISFIQRPHGFYRENVRSRVRAIGGGFDIRHTHVWGRLAEPLKDAGVVFGGYAADTLFKSAWMGNVEKNIKKIGPERLNPIGMGQPTGIKIASAQDWLDPGVSAAVDARRLAHHERIQEFRPKSAGNWHTLWPLGSQRVAYAHYLAIRLACPEVVEPFLAPQVYELAARMPDEFRVDRKAFRAAFASPMGKAGWLLTSSGRIPRLGGYVGHWVQLGTVISRALGDRATSVSARMRGRMPINQGAWSNEHDVYRDDLSEALSESQLEGVRVLMNGILTAEEANEFFKPCGGAVPDLVRNRVVQVAYLVGD